MTNKADRKLAVVQSFRKQSIPDWIARCLESVERWAERRNYSYFLWGDEFYDLCGDDYLSRGFKNPQGITNLARLIVTRNYLAQGFDAVVWLDADVFVFDPEKLDLMFPPDHFALGYAFGQEVWMAESGTVTQPMAHNAATYFTTAAKDLDFLIDAIRQIDSGREIKHNHQVGVRLLRGLQYSLDFHLFPEVALFSPRLISAILRNETRALRRYGHAFGAPSQAANLCLSRVDAVGDKAMQGVMTLLERSRGEVINVHAGAKQGNIEKARFNLEVFSGRVRQKIQGR